MTSTGADLQAFARLIESLTPWLDQVVIIGGWAHRLHRLHPAAQTLDYAPLTTLDADVALPIELKVEGQDIYQCLQANGFQAQFLGEHKPPSSHYHLTAERGEFYAEFLTKSAPPRAAATCALDCHLVTCQWLSSGRRKVHIGSEPGKFYLAKTSDPGEAKPRGTSQGYAVHP
jgi:Nucleotidyltransferase